MNRDLEAARKTRDFTTLKLWTVDWPDFNESDFVKSVKYIHGFTFHGKVSGLGRWNKVIKADRFALQVLSSLEEALQEAGFVNLSAIDTAVEAEGVLFRYLDTEYAFELSFRGDGSISLRRLGSRLETFHRWYVNFMPSMPAILIRAMAAMESDIDLFLKPEESSANRRARPDSSKDRVRLLRASFNFEVTLHSFADQAGKPRRNLDVLRQNLAVKLPDESGSVTNDPLPLDFDRYGRMDYRVNLNHEDNPGISQYLAVEGPSNADWRALFFNLGYVGENYYTTDGRRQIFDQDAFLTAARCADAYISFFRDIGLDGFVRSVARDFSFETTANVIA